MFAYVTEVTKLSVEGLWVSDSNYSARWRGFKFVVPLSAYTNVLCRGAGPYTAPTLVLNG